jgi:DNA-directed RNA polymerase specialized sigma24 family protein
MGDKGVEACPAATLEISETTRIARTRTSELPPKARKAIELVYQKGLSAKEAAKIAGCDFKVFRKRLDHGLKRLKEEMGNP